jgi:signal transduction histidine kinase
MISIQDIFDQVQFDLLGVIVAVTGIAVLATIVFLRSKKSITSKSFFFFSFITVFWGLSNYFLYKFTEPDVVLLALRLHIFLSIWHAYSFFQLSYVFPSEKKELPHWHRYFLLPLAFFTSTLLLIPFVFSRVRDFVSYKDVVNPEKSDGILLAGIVTFSFFISGIIFLFRKINDSKGDERRQVILMFTGMSLTAGLLLLFSFILPIGFHNYNFVPYGALFLFPVIVFTAYAIYIVELFHVKNIFAGLFTFFLCVVSLIQLVISDSIEEVLLRTLVFVLTLAISIQLVKNTFEVELANEQKSELMSFATHEIRTPITVMRGYASLLLDGDTGDVSPRMRDLLQKILVSGNEVVSLLSQYLNKSKLELGQLEYTLAKIDEAELVNEILVSFQVHAEQKGITLSKSVDTSTRYIVFADQVKLREVFTNIIDNAIKYTPEGEVLVAIKKKDGEIILTVTDTGVGIKDDTMSLLFREFSRSDIQKLNTLGTGLGLYLAKTFIEAHHGKVWAESEGEGKGSTFFVELPEASSLIHKKS